MSKARKTRELWSASFSFSLLMKCLIDEFEKYGELLSPSVKVKLPLHGAGVYPDRCFYLIKKNLTAQEISEAKNKAIIEFKKLTAYEIEAIPYFQIYIVQKLLNKNPIQQLNQILDGLELSNKYFSKSPFNIDEYWLDSGFFQKLYMQGYGKDNILPSIKVKYRDGRSKIINRFKSIPEIASTELQVNDPVKYWKSLGIQFIRTATGEINFEQIAQDKEDDQNQDEIINKLKTAFGDDFKFRHKYFTIIQADGDNVGSLIREIESKNGCIMDFSNALNDFVTSAATEIVKYGAFPIYLGGDDLLFFAPLTNETYEGLSVDFSSYFPEIDSQNNFNIKGDNVFFLMTILNNLFKGKLAPIVSQFMPDKQVSLSFGLSVGYYKKPMNEILSESYDLLFHKAKKQACKNYIALKLEKHSGQSFDFGFTQNTRLYYHFLKLTTESKNKDENFLNSVMFKINNQKEVIINIVEDTEKLKCFFNENFNESNHANYKQFFREVSLIIFETFQWFKHESEDQKMSRIYSSLRFIQFLNSKDSHE